MLATKLIPAVRWRVVWCAWVTASLVTACGPSFVAPRVIVTAPVTPELQTQPAITLAPTIVRTIKPTPESVYPTGKPVSTWRGFPIMPKAVAGDEKSVNGEASYVFTINAPINDVSTFYHDKLDDDNWIRDPVYSQRGDGALIVLYVRIPAKMISHSG